jgi:hypothetical protein
VRAVHRRPNRSGRPAQRLQPAPDQDHRQEFDYPEYLERIIYFENMAPERRRVVLIKEQEFYDYQDNLEPTPREKIERLSEIIFFYRAKGHHVLGQHGIRNGLRLPGAGGHGFSD